VTRGGGRAPGIGRLLRGYRVAAGLTQDQLASAAGISVAGLRDIEQGRTARPRASSVTRLAGVLPLGPREREELAALLAGPRPGHSRAGPGRDGRAPGGGAAEVVRLSVLGPLAAWRDGTPLALGPARQRAVLGLLALHEGSGLSCAAIADALWGEAPPATARDMIQGYVSRLRGLLWPAAAPRHPVPGPGPAALRWDGSGYRLAAGAVHCDLAEFDQLSWRARQDAAAGDAGQAAARYEQALRLWRGPPLADLDILHGHPVLAGLERRHADVVIEYADAAGAVGRPGDATRSLWLLAGREPLDERVHARLMIALAASGQRAAALRVHEALRQRLDEELGVLPGPELTGAHTRILRQEATAAANPPGPPRARSGPAGRDRPVPPPRQLPPDGGHFTGRERELAELSALLGQARQPGTGAVVISAIGGTAGVGKTALALHWAHQVAAEFPDGQLYVNLRGYDVDRPVPAADALAAFLRALGVAGPDIPEGTEERAARYRSLLAGQRVLVVADNAGSVEQVRPLLPGTPASVAVVTSRDSLAGLVARDGARRLDLGVLPLADAVGLLRTLIGRRVGDEPAAAAVLAGQCARLPLALRVAAEFAVAHPGTALADLVSELAEQHRRLDLLDAGGDSRTALRAVLSWSYRDLAPDAAHLLRRLGLHPGPDFEPCAAAALAGGTAAEAGQLLGTLARAHLVQRMRGRYAMHDLLRAYASELGAAQEDGRERRAARTRLFDFYLRTAAEAMDTLYPAERDRRPRIPPPGGPAPAVAAAAPPAARAWLDAERANLLAVAGQAASQGWPGHSIQLAATLFRHLEAGGYYAEAVAIHTSACRAARDTGDHAAEAAALISLGTAYGRLGRGQQATGHYERALGLYQQAGDRAGQARALNNLGNIEYQQGRSQQATRHLGEAGTLYRDAGNRVGESRVLNNLALIEQRQGRYHQAAGHLERALVLFRAAGDQNGEAYALDNLGTVYLRQGRCQQAAEHVGQALALFRETGDRIGEADALSILGDAGLRGGRPQEAACYHRQALALFRNIGMRLGEAKALNGLGEASLAAGYPGRARAQHRTALSLLSQASDQYQEARGHSGLGHALDASGHPARARYHWGQALARYTALGAPEAGDLTRCLAAAAGRGEAPG
jgi:DNA-binding SARP family transcriptional activator/tetratricopeptide (TPR) repeat protein